MIPLFLKSEQYVTNTLLSKVIIMQKDGSASMSKVQH